MTQEEQQQVARLREQLRAINERLDRVASSLPPGSASYSAVVSAIATAIAAARTADRMERKQ